MREAIEDLRMRARWYRNVPRSKNAMGPDKRDAKAEQADRAADLLEALSNPPETVEELERRAGELWGLNVFAEEDRASDDPSCWGVEVRTGHAEIYISDRPMPECIRAAWFAIVALTQEVGRG